MKYYEKERLATKSKSEFPLLASDITLMRHYYNELIKYHSRQPKGFEKAQTAIEINKINKWLEEFRRM